MDDQTADTGAAGVADADPVAAVVPAGAPAAKPVKSHRTGLRGRLIFLTIIMALVIGGFALVGRSIPLPVWVVAEVETRVNEGLAAQMPGSSVALGAVNLTVDTGGIPRLALEDVRVLRADGAALLTLPEVRLALDGASLLQGQTRLSGLRITGARLDITRDKNGRFDFDLGGDAAAPKIARFSDLFDLADQVLAAPGLAQLRSIEAEALTLTLTDERIGRRFELGDGRLTLQNRVDELAAELAVSLQGENGVPGRAVVQLVSQKRASTARVTVDFNDIPAADLAAQLPLLQPLGSLEAAISGRLSAGLGDTGVTALEAALIIGKGALRPTEAARPVVFDRAAMSLTYDQKTGRIALSGLDVQSPTLRAKAKGQAFLIDAQGTAITGPLTGALPASFLTQISFEQVMIDPEGVFAEPVVFSAGALDMRLGVQPFLVEIGQLSLAEDQRRLVLKGRIGADAAGWTTSLDLDLNEIAHDRLLAIWPQTLLAKTRAWLEKNLLAGALSDVKAALRVTPGAEPRLHLAYNYENAELRFMPSLPPVQGAKGYSTIEGRTYTMVLTEGRVTAPQGGQIDVAGSVFAVPDVAQIPATAEVRLSTKSSLTATLSLLNLPPFEFLTKSDRPVDLGQGRAEVETRLSFPLQKKIGFGDVSYQVTGKVFDFSSTILVPKRTITAPVLNVTVDPKGLAITGAGRLGEVPFDVTYAQSFAPDQKGRSKISGEIVLSQAVAEEFGLGLPTGMVSGNGPAAVTIDLVKGAAGKLSLTSGLTGIGLTIPEIGWTKAAASKGRLVADVTLGAVPKVDRLTVEAGGLKAEGKVTMRADGGGLDLARFDRVTLDKWLDSTVELSGRGPGKPVGIALKGGSVDLRHVPGADQRGSGKGGAKPGPMRLDLDRLIVTSNIALTNFSGDFSLAPGFSGDFTAQMNGGPEVTGTAVPNPNGTAVRLRARDGGAVFAAAGLFSSARGGAMELTLTPRATEGHYDGVLAVKNIRVRNTSVLAELLNAISVVGALEQLNGQGLVFQDVQGEFLLTPRNVDLRRGSAIGASLGVSMAGLYDSAAGRLAMQGVISPIYLLNGVGAVLTKRGEGLFGFNYSLSGTADSPEVSVNPLSILTPGMFRNIFRGNGRVGADQTAPKTDARD